jgi:hypothetical protein
MSERTAHLLEEFESLPTAEKEVFTVELLAHARAQGLPVPLYVERALHPQAGGVKPTLSPDEHAAAFRSWAENHPHTTPVLSDEAISRETIYSDRG